MIPAPADLDKTANQSPEMGPFWLPPSSPEASPPHYYPFDPSIKWLGEGADRI
jgi:hypothetical protein